MPAKLENIIAALCTEQLVSQFAGVDLIRRGTATVTGSGSWDRFPTIHDLLNGIGAVPELTSGGTIAGESLGECVTVAANDAGALATFTAGIDAEDRIYIENETAAFKVKAMWGDILGFTDEWTESEAIPNTAKRRVTAPNDWKRGQFLMGNDPGSGLIGFRIAFGADPATEFNFYPPLGWFPGVLEWVRSQATSDKLGNAAGVNLTMLDRLAGPHPATRWFLNDAGRVCNVRPYYVDDLEWLSEEFRDWLGFTGEETATNQNGTGTYLLTATNAPQGLLWLDRPIEYFEPEIKATRNVQELSDARFEQAHVSTVHGWRLRFAISGLAATVDRLMDAEENFFDLLWRSEFFTVFLNTLEKRIAVREKVGYSIEVSGQDDKRMGCHRLVLDPGVNGMPFNLEDPEFRMRYFLELLGWNFKAA